MTPKLLFTPTKMGGLNLRSRVVMAPLTRCRAVGNIPNALMAEYYSQRASAGLIISEATQVDPMGVGYINTPGIHSPAQIEGWKLVTSAVHQAGGKILLQLWHVGRVSHPLFLNGATPVAPSALPVEGAQVYTTEGKREFPVPRALELEEIPQIVEQYRRGAEYAKIAGFDGVEIHAANGYLIDQFLRDGSNHRTDSYGGSVQNRARFLLEVVEAVTSVWPAEQVGIRFSPKNPFNGMSDSDPLRTFSHAAQELNRFSPAYLHIVEPPADHRFGQPGERITPHLRRVFRGSLIANGGMTAEGAETILSEDGADAIAFGTLFIANPDLPRRLELGAELNSATMATYYSSGAEGYTDYRTLD